MGHEERVLELERDPEIDQREAGVGGPPGEHHGAAQGQRDDPAVPPEERVLHAVAAARLHILPEVHAAQGASPEAHREGLGAAGMVDQKGLVQGHRLHRHRQAGRLVGNSWTSRRWHASAALVADLALRARGESPFRAQAEHRVERYLAPRATPSCGCLREGHDPAAGILAARLLGCGVRPHAAVGDDIDAAGSGAMEHRPHLQASARG
mmetsp:Transcript_79954/g.224409  ORF Transcript_79954/g.224409 Transcript_79954/m.224409 type:complete len:209 (-) Transcript_79954:649-1275(-)